MGREKKTNWWSDTGSGVTERAKVPQDLMNIRLGCFPALCLGGEGVSVKSKVAKNLVNSGGCNFFGRMLKSSRTTRSGVPFSGGQLRRTSMFIVEVAKRDWRTAWSSNSDLVMCSSGRTW